MSRTFRRTTKAIVRDHVGSLNDIDSYDLRQYQTTDPQVAYRLKCVRFTRDRRRGRFGVPRDYRRMHGSKVMRTQTAQEFHRCLYRSEWEDHLPPRFPSNAGHYWW